MALLKYLCDTCDREIELAVDFRSVGYIGKCNITDNCKGNLTVIGSKVNSLAPSIPVDVNGLDNWVQRASLYHHFQEVPAAVWKINHKLNYNPSIQAYLETGMDVVETTPASVEYVDSNNLIVKFNGKQHGICLCTASTNVDPYIVPDVVADSTSILLTPSSEFIIATNNSVWPATNSTVDLLFSFISIVSGDVIASKLYSFNRNIALFTTWTTGEVLINGHIYTVRGATLDINSLRSLGITNRAIVRIDSSIKKGDVRILLTNPPYNNNSDINDNVFVDMTNIVDNNCIFEYDDLYINSNVVHSTYPLIRKL